MVADRHVLVVRQERLVRTKLSADIGRVVDADVEIGVVADAIAGRCIVQSRCTVAGRSPECDLLSGPFASSSSEMRARNRLPRASAQTHQVVELVPARDVGRRRRARRRTNPLDGPRQRDPGSRRRSRYRRARSGSPARREHAERQVLNRKIGDDRSRIDPAPQCRDHGFRRAASFVCRGASAPASG